jgi:hypothetical protein
MKHEPQIQQRAAQPYVGIRMPVTMEGFAEAVDTGFPYVFGWLAKHGVTPAIHTLPRDRHGDGARDRAGGAGWGRGGG